MSKVTMVVKFGDSIADGSRGNVVDELDDTRNIDASGTVLTRFRPGEEAYIRVHHDLDLRIDKVISTDGMVVATGSENQARADRLLFVDEGTQALSCLPVAGIAVDWQGRVGTGLSRDMRDMSIASGWPCLAGISYSAKFSLYKLVPPPLTLGENEEYEIVCVIYMEAAA